MSSAIAVRRHEAHHLAAPVNVLTLTPFYPTTEDETEGCFIAEPLSVSDQFSIRNQVLAVRPAYRARASAGPSGVPATRHRYICLPGNMGLASSGSFLYAAVAQRIGRLVANSQVDLIHAHGALPCGHTAMLIRRRIGVPFVVTVHGLDAFSTRQVHGFLWRRRAMRNSRAVYEAAERVICISAKVEERVLEFAPQARTVVIYNGVNTEMFAPPRVQSSENVILSIGNLIPIKGHEVLLRAFARVYTAVPGALLRIIGDGPEKPSLQRLSVGLGISNRTQFLSRCSRSEIAKQMKQCTVFALPSNYEGLGCVYLEAMACGAPAIGCYDQGIEEIIASEKNGWLIHTDSVEELEHALLTLLRDPSMRKEIGVEARKIILRDFTLADQARKLSEIYRECVA